MDYKADPANPGWAKVWAVLRPTPWHVVGAYPTKEEAEEVQKKQDQGYEVRYGSLRLGSDDFMNG